MPSTIDYAERVREFVRRELADPSTSWSVGGFGAIGEFHQAAGEARREATAGAGAGEALERVTPQGGIRIALSAHTVVRAYELPSARKGLWLHGAVLCAPAAEARMGCRATLSELGPDADALCTADRADILFDLGLAIDTIDFCVRTGDPALIAALRGAVGRSILEHPALFERLKRDSPHRVVRSRLGRVEVYQPIGAEGGHSPEGCHTHLLPELLRVNRTHPATLPLPMGYAPCVSLYPMSPVQDEHGLIKPFDRRAYERFQAWLAEFGDAAYVHAKAALVGHVRAGRRPERTPIAPRRIERNAWRIAARQLAQLDGMSEVLAAWLARLDPGTARVSAGAH
jgi:hypothetical protein